jgi:hypothetical protein
VRALLASLAVLAADGDAAVDAVNTRLHSSTSKPRSKEEQDRRKNAAEAKRRRRAERNRRAR